MPSLLLRLLRSMFVVCAWMIGVRVRNSHHATHGVHCSRSPPNIVYPGTWDLLPAIGDRYNTMPACVLDVSNMHKMGRQAAVPDPTPQLPSY